jgi:hypothetical protein
MGLPEFGGVAFLGCNVRIDRASKSQSPLKEAEFRVHFRKKLRKLTSCVFVRVCVCVCVCVCRLWTGTCLAPDAVCVPYDGFVLRRVRALPWDRLRISVRVCACMLSILSIVFFLSFLCLRLIFSPITTPTNHDVTTPTTLSATHEYIALTQ